MRPGAVREGEMTMDYTHVVMIQEGGWWRVLARYTSYIEAKRASCATSADGVPTKILRTGDPRIEALQLRRTKKRR
jgi:hypothetical protein